MGGNPADQSIMRLRGTTSVVGHAPLAGGLTPARDQTTPDLVVRSFNLLNARVQLRQMTPAPMRRRCHG